jgi:hypothetical protein
MKTLNNLNNDMHAHDCLFIPCEAYPPFHSYEAYPPFHSYVHVLCFTVQTLLLLFFANHAFFKYNKPINV